MLVFCKQTKVHSRFSLMMTSVYVVIIASISYPTMKYPTDGTLVTVFMQHETKTQQQWLHESLPLLLSPMAAVAIAL